MRLRVDLSDAFSLMAVLGLAAILDDETQGVRVSWETSQWARVDAPGLADDQIAEAVRKHAQERREGSWISAVFTLDGGIRAALSPRIGTPANGVSWSSLQDARHKAIDSVAKADRLDRRLIGALGEPAYWARQKEKSFVDHGASAWEMKTRNRGEEFLQNRLSLLARSVAARSTEQIRVGLIGDEVVDEVGKNTSTSRTPTGLRAPGVADNAMAWCALWGISLFPVRPVVSTNTINPIRSHTAGAVHVRGNATWFGTPIFGRPVSVGRVRSVVRSSALAEVLRATAAGGQAPGAYATLARQGVVEVRAFRQAKTDNPNAPEPWLLPGVPASDPQVS